ncbi:PIF1-like protein [Mya arenaria]|uniref:ATP-dependent DNA helicase n=1 Tax=Mya arenaria TaxID=6604 RepID=A0ABY7G3Z0_MYAAR|nr:PIF1-like protein [Mya arenaria]
MFDTIESICRNVKKNNAFFGGLQLILAGDFYQLPPVPDQLYGETGKFCFQSKSFYSSVPHHVDLKTVFRQEDNNLIQSINELEKGELSDDTVQFINTVTKDIDHSEETVFLFATNYKAKLHNHDQVMKMEGDLKTYKSRDEGDAYYLNRFQAPPILGLKISCKVMLVTNLSDNLVNGLTGRVKELTEDHVKVHFEMVDQIVTIERKLFVKFDPVSRRALAKRVQFPLILAFGLTIHKSQGMSLKSVIIDCEDAKIPGQIGVALGRATSSEQLQVKNFKPSLVSKHPQAIKNFYDCSFKPSCDDLSCCKAEFISRDLEVDLFAPFDIDNVELTEDEDPDDITGPENFVNEDEPSSEELPEFGPSPFPEYINMNTIVLGVRNEYANTPFENNISALSDNVLQNDKKINEWLCQQFLSVKHVSESNFEDGEKAQQKQITRFCTDINSYLKTTKYFESCKDLLLHYNASELQDGQFFCTSILFKLQYLEIEHKSSLVKFDSVIEERTKPSKKSDVGRGNIRHIGGYCVAKLKYKYQKKVQSALYDTNKVSQLENARKKVLFLSHITVSYSDLTASSTSTDTLKTTHRKQNIRQSLTNISDVTFEFFEKMNEAIRNSETFSNLH